MSKYLNRLRRKRHAKHNKFATVPTVHGAVNVMVADLMEQLIAAIDEVNA